MNAYGLVICHLPWLSPPSSRTNYPTIFVARDGRFLAWGQLSPLMLPLQSKDGKIGVVSKHTGSIFGVRNLDRQKVSKHRSIYLKKKKKRKKKPDHEDPSSDISRMYSRYS